MDTLIKSALDQCIDKRPDTFAVCITYMGSIEPSIVVMPRWWIKLTEGFWSLLGRLQCSNDAVVIVFVSLEDYQSITGSPSKLMEELKFMNDYASNKSVGLYNLTGIAAHPYHKSSFFVYFGKYYQSKPEVKGFTAVNLKPSFN